MKRYLVLKKRFRIIQFESEKMSIKLSVRGRQRIGINLAVFLVAAMLFVTLSPAGEWLLAPGGMIPGHEKLSCESCHQKTSGTTRQQLQAKVQYWVGTRTDSIDFGHKTVGNKACLECHRRPKDNHPVYRFMEPRFREVRQKLSPQYCVSCHREHQANRVNLAPEECKVCHKKISLKRDPLDISHKALAKKNQWKTCLGCHDYHGNHSLRIPKKIEERIKDDKIISYFQQGDSPYPLPKKYKAKKDLKDETK